MIEPKFRRHGACCAAPSPYLRRFNGLRLIISVDARVLENRRNSTRYKSAEWPKRTNSLEHGSTGEVDLRLVLKENRIHEIFIPPGICRCDRSGTIGFRSIIAIERTDISW
jgi:hypothetical protein